MKASRESIRSNRAAAANTGSANKNENSVLLRRFNPANMPPMMEAPAREVPGTKARVAALDLASTLRDARNQAITRSTSVDVTFDTETASYSIAGSEETELPRGVAIVILDRCGYVSETRRVAGHSLQENRNRYTLRFYADGSSSGLEARIGPEQGGGWIVVVDWLFGGASVSRASGNEA